MPHAYFLGGNGGAKRRSCRPDGGVPFRRALHTFGTPCTLRCTPFFIEVCRRFFLFSLVYEPFPMLSRCPARTTERTNRHNLPSPCRTPSVRPPTSDCRPQGGHPCIERMRDAHGRSNALRPLQRRFKARKKPEGYTSTPTGLKRLKTQITAFRGNENGKGTPSGVPQPIHKRKLILVKEEFDASSSGGDGGS